MFDIQYLEYEGRQLAVFLPPSYTQSERQYPVVYLHDGAKLMMSALNYMYRLFREGMLEELIVVGIETSARNREYTPWARPAVTAGREAFGGGGAQYIDEVADRIKPYIDGSFRTDPRSEVTGMIGYSLGGLITLYAAYHRSEVFGRLGMLSPSIWYDGMLDYVQQHTLSPKGQRMYISVGNREGVYKHNMQQQAVNCTLQVYRWLYKQTAEDQLQLDIVEGATHDLIFMARQFPEALQWLYAPQTATGDPRNAKEVHEQQPHVISPTETRITPVTQCAVPGAEVWDMTSLHNGLTYRIFVHLPLKPSPPEGYPVLYTVDGNAYFASLNDAMRLQTRHPRGLPSGMIVSIGYAADGPFVSERRFRDLTIPYKQQGLRPDGTSWPVNGGADHFLDFIEYELMPLIQTRYDVNRQQQSLFGHSLGGFFTLYTLIQRSHLFQTYVAGSPSLWWKERVLFDMLPTLENQLQHGLLECSLMIAIGGTETVMHDNAEQFYERLRPFVGQGLQRLRYDMFEGEGHMSMLQPMFSPMLRFVFAKEDMELCV